MKTWQLTLKQGESLDQMKTFLNENADVGLVFCSPGLARDAKFREVFSGITKPVIGCSTAGEISNESVERDSVVCTAIKFERGTTVRTAMGRVTAADQSYAAGAAMAEGLKGARSVLMFAPGVNVNGSELIRGATTTLGPTVTLSGGLAGDEFRFVETHTLLNGQIYADQVVALGFFGEHLKTSAGSQGGWRPFGPPRRVTRAEGNVLFELDGQSALSIYETYLGEKAKDLPGTGLLYPFAIVEGQYESVGLIRTILGMDVEKGALILAGDVPKDGLLRLMHAGTEGLVEGATRAAEQVLTSLPPNDGPGGTTLALLVSCVGRRAVMGDDVDDELDAVKDVFKSDTVVTGFYSYGEISPFEKTEAVELHNQTMTITLLSE